MIFLEYRVTQNATGKLVTIRERFSDNDMAHSRIYSLTEGNESCDCNRACEFDVDEECSEDKYSVSNLKINGVDVVEFKDYEWNHDFYAKLCGIEH